MPKKVTYWNDEWKNVPKYKCFSAAPQSTNANDPDPNALPQKPTRVYCSACKKTFSLSNIGRSALDSHLNGKDHTKAASTLESNYGIRLFTTSSKSAAANPPATPPATNTVGASGSSTTGGEATARRVVAQIVEGSAEDVDDPVDSGARPAAAAASTSSTSVIVSERGGLAGLNKYLVKNDVTKAEILWCFHTVLNHSSLSASGKAVKLFPFMFPDSLIAAKMELGRLKIGYTIVHGLAPFFRDRVLQELREASCFVAMFDESLNKCAQNTQMDIAVKFWSNEKDEVVTKSLDSAFLGRTRASDLVPAFCDKFPTSLLSLLFLVGMDSPTVNFKFLKDLQNHLKEMFDVGDPTMVVMGSCGLHVVYNSFKEGVNATDWLIVMFLRSLYNVFKDVPARRSKYTEWTGSSKFGQKYCAVRWLNNASCAETGIKVLPNLITFIDKVEKGPREDKIKSASYSFLVKAVKDKLLGPKLAYFAYVARLVEPFLTKYQTNDPMAPFLHTDLTALLKDLLTHFVKPDSINSKTDISDVDFKSEGNIVPAKDFKFSFSVKDVLRKVDVTAKEMLEFKQDCILFLQKMVGKILEKSPLPYKLCKAITFCDPELIFKSESASVSRLRVTLTHLERRNWFAPTECDSIEKEFKDLLSKAAFKNAVREYDRETRLDHFWRGILTTFKCSALLSKLVKMLLIVSHANAFSERGFSINKEIIVENQLGPSLVAQRQVYDAVNSAGGILEVEITDKMVNRVRLARSEWEEARKARAGENKEKEQKREEERMVAEEVQELRAKKQKLLVEKQLEIDSIDERLNTLTKK